MQQAVVDASIFECEKGDRHVWPKWVDWSKTFGVPESTPNLLDWDFINTKEKEVVFVGVDVSKDTLDVYRPDTGENIKLQNTEVDINGLCKVLKKKNVLVAMEETGGY